MPLYLGLDAALQGLTAVVIEIGRETRRIVFDRQVNFDRDLPEYGTIAGQLQVAGEAVAPPPIIWADALDRIMGRLAAAAEVDVDDIRAMSGSGPADLQVRFDYCADGADPVTLRPAMPLVRQLKPNVGPTGSVCAYLETLLGVPNGRLAEFWQRRYSLPNAAMVPWTSDRATRNIATGVIHDATISVVFGTSDTVATSTHALSFRNGSLAREWLRLEYGLSWDAVAGLLEQSPGNDGLVMLPWVEREITPPVAHTGVRRFGFDRHDMARNVRGLIEGQLMAIANHVEALAGVTAEKVIASGDAAAERAVLQVMANIFGADVYRLTTGNSAALGAALRAYHADRLAAGEPVSWQTVVSGFTEPRPGHRVSPNPRDVATYARLRRHYALLETLHRDRRPIC
jgi:sugar (pentulose or hexulose) kinase